MRNGVGPFICFLISIPSFSQSSSAVVNQLSEWSAVTTSIKLTKKIAIYADGHFRYVENFQPMQNQLRFGVEYLVSDKLSVMPVGFAYIRNFIYGKQPTRFENNERRIYQQVIYKHASGRFGFNHRFRIEERFIQFHSVNASDQVVDEGFTNLQVRLRYRGTITYPLNSTAIKAGTLFAAVYDEIFISRGSKVTYEKPDQNRFFAGLGYQFAKDISVQTGFFYQILIKSNGAQQENNVGLLTQFSYNFDFSKNGN